MQDTSLSFDIPDHFLSFWNNIGFDSDQYLITIEVFLRKIFF
jgi:hypothetical protein